MTETFPYFAPKPARTHRAYKRLALDTNVRVSDIHGSIVPLAIRAESTYARTANGNLKQDATVAFEAALQDRFERGLGLPGIHFTLANDSFSMGGDLLDDKARTTASEVGETPIKFRKRIGQANIPFSKAQQPITGTSQDGMPFEAVATMYYQVCESDHALPTNTASAFLDMKAKQFETYWTNRKLGNFIETYDKNNDHEKSTIWHEGLCTVLASIEKYQDIVVLDTVIQFTDQFWKDLITAFVVKHKKQQASYTYYGPYICGLIGAIPCSQLKGDLKFSKCHNHYQAIEACNEARYLQSFSWLVLLWLQVIAGGCWYGLWHLTDLPFGHTVPWTILLAILSLAFGPFWLVLSALM